MAATREDNMRKIRALLDKAASTTFDAERDALLSKADEMMTKWVIESWELELAKPASTREKPILREYEYGQSTDRNLDDRLHEIFYDLAKHCRVKLGSLGWRRAKLVGYESDIDYLDLLFTNIRLHFQLNLIPHADPNLTYLENLAILKEAGFKWQRIYEMLVPVFPDHFSQAKVPEHDPYPSDIVVGTQRYRKLIFRPIGVRFTKEYTEFCKSEGRDRIYSNPETYRRNFMEGYVWRIRSRIRDMDEATTAGQALVLRGREEDLLEELYKLFPNQRPKAPHPADCECDVCHHMRCRDAKCKRPFCVQMRKPVRYRAPAEKKVDFSAYSRGRDAANKADLIGPRNNLPGQKGIGG